MAAGRGTGPGIVLVQENFGVGEWIRAVAAELAAAGYVVGAPDLDRRIQPRFAVAPDERSRGSATWCQAPRGGQSIAGGASASPVWTRQRAA